jgi:DNA-3-methyladenine glycosylase II
MYQHAAAALAASDPVLGSLIARVGPCRLEVDRSRSPFQALVRAVAFQQLHGKAAEAILTRFLALFPESSFPSPGELWATDVEALRGVGFSGPKARYINEIARMTVEGVVPPRQQLHRMSDEGIIERLTAIAGVGRWTVEMLLIFSLGRPDVLPVADFGVRNGYRITFRKRAMPTPAEVKRRGERWKPYRSIASWYLWRAVDLAQAAEGR